MEKFTEFHEGNNKVTLSVANYLVSAYGMSGKFKHITVPIERHIFIDLKARLSSLRDLLIVDSMIYKVSIGDFSMSYNSLSKARKAIKHIEDQHIASLFGARA